MSRFHQALLAIFGCSAALVSVSCQSPPDIQADQSPPALGRFDAFAHEVERLVVKGDLDGLQALWLTEAEVSNCRLEKPEARRPADIVDAHAQGFVGQARKTMGARQRGKAIFNNRHTEPRAKFGRSQLVGERCAASTWARINVIVVPEASAEQVIEHRFNALLVGDAWRLYRYLPNEPDCSKASGRKHMGCKKFLELSEG